MRHMADQVNNPSEALACNQFFKSRAFRSFPNDPADKVEALITQRSTRLYKEAVVLHPVKASDREQAESSMLRLGHRRRCRPGQDAVNAQTLHHYFFRARSGIVAQNVLAVKIRDRHTESAGA